MYTISVIKLDSIGTRDLTWGSKLVEFIALNPAELGIYIDIIRADKTVISAAYVKTGESSRERKKIR